MVVTSNAMTDYELKNIDPEDIEDLLVKVETSFDIKFGEGELAHIKTFGQLCDFITDKIKLDSSADCTTQQAFYKLRDAFSATLQADSKTMTTDHSLADLLPRENRRTLVKNLEKHLGFKLHVLRPPHWVTLTLVVILLGSIVAWFLKWQIGLLGVSCSIAGLWISVFSGNVLDIQTVGQLAEKMTRENYLKSRRNPRTFNKKEIEKVLTDLFSVELALDKSKLTRDAAIN